MDITLEFTNGYKIPTLAAHQFKGNSMWNPTHAGIKKAKFNPRYRLVSQGHLHTSAYQQIPIEGWGFTHVIMVGSYKRYDEYPLAEGMDNLNLFPAALTIMDAKAIEPVRVFWDIEAGIDYLKYLRAKK
jgi:hypothetical protein